MDENAAYTDVLRIKKKFRESLQLSCYFNDAQVVQVERYSDQVLKLKKEAHNKWKPGIKLRKKNLVYPSLEIFFLEQRLGPIAKGVEILL